MVPMVGGNERVRAAQTDRSEVKLEPRYVGVVHAAALERDRRELVETRERRGRRMTRRRATPATCSTTSRPAAGSSDALACLD